MTSINKTLLLLLLQAAILAIEPTLFERSPYVGTIFSPYSKFHGDKSNYSVPEIEIMLELVSKKFQKITTYGMGTGSATSKWNGTNDAEGLTAIAAALLNKKQGDHSIIIDIGAWQGDASNQITKQEVQNAFDVATEANKIFNGTVSGIIMTTHWGDHQLNNLFQSITDNENISKSLVLDIGIRSSDCGGLSTKALQPDSFPLVFKVVQKLNFIICHILPVGHGANTNISQVVDVLGKQFLKWRSDFDTVNTSIRTSGQTGWPSKEMSKEGVIGSIDNMKHFWHEMVNWSKINKFRVDVFTAFDEPWKSAPMGPVESHYGWWMRISNDSNGLDAFIEKINYREPGKSYGMEIGLGLLGAFIVLGLFGSIAFLYLRLKAVQAQLLTKADIDEFEKGKPKMEGDESTEDALRLPYDRSYEISKGKFLIDRSKLLGSGQFGSVYKGKLEDNPNDIAFKMTQSNCSSNNLKSLLSEIKIMIHVGKHSNVVSIIGAYTGEIKQGIIMIAIEFCDLGSLEKHLRTNQNSFLTFSAQNDTVRYANDPTSMNNKTVIQLEDLIKWSYHIACGMEHIASKNVIHADLAIRNVLLTSDGTAKITDFGLSRRLYEYTNYVKSNQEPLPWRWMAIESIKHMEFSTKSDVWAFGITLWEIFSLGDTPYPGLAWTVDFTHQLEEGLRMHPPKYGTQQIYTKMAECWNDDPEKRPEFSDLKDFFETVLQEVTTLEYQNLQTTYKAMLNNDLKK